jgi:hypothetical protein
MRDAANNRAQSEMWAEPLVDHSSFFGVTKIPISIPHHVSVFLNTRHSNAIPMCPDRTCPDLSVVSSPQLIGPEKSAISIDCP